jgi:hypothetical protein
MAGNKPLKMNVSRPQSRQSAKLFLQSSELGLPQPLTPQASVPQRWANTLT